MDPIRATQRARQPIGTTARDLCTIVCWQTEEVEWGRERAKERYMTCWMSWDLSWCTTQHHEEHLLDFWTAPQANAPSLPGVINFKKKNKNHEKGIEAIEEFWSRLKVIFRVPPYCRPCVKLFSFSFKGILRVWQVQLNWYPKKKKSGGNCPFLVYEVEIHYHSKVWGR